MEKSEEIYALWGVKIRPKPCSKEFAPFLSYATGNQCCKYQAGWVLINKVIVNAVRFGREKVKPLVGTYM